MLIGKYKKIVDNLSIKTMNEVIVGGFIVKNDYDKVENLIGLPMKQRKMFKKIRAKKSIEQRYNEIYQNFFENCKFKRTCKLISSRQTKKSRQKYSYLFYGKYKIGKTNKRNYFVNINLRDMVTFKNLANIYFRE